MKIIDTDKNVIFKHSPKGGAWYDTAIELDPDEVLAGFYGKFEKNGHNNNWSGHIIGFGAITVKNHSLLKN